jgi:hypothetical protein
MQGVVDELRELLGDRLHVAVLDDRGRVMQVRPEHERVSGGYIDAVRSPGAAFRGITIGVVGGVMRHGKDKLAILLRKLLEDFLLHKFHVDNRKGASGLFRGEDVTVAERDGDLERLDLWFAE